MIKKWTPAEAPATTYYIINTLLRWLYTFFTTSDYKWPYDYLSVAEAFDDKLIMFVLDLSWVSLVPRPK
jgi:hypothetical protein